MYVFYKLLLYFFLMREEIEFFSRSSVKMYLVIFSGIDREYNIMEWNKIRRVDIQVIQLRYIYSRNKCIVSCAQDIKWLFNDSESTLNHLMSSSLI